MRCTSCNKEFFSQPDKSEAYFSAGEEGPIGKGFRLAIQLCPSCYVPLVLYAEGSVVESSSGVRMHSIDHEEVVYPSDTKQELPDEVPEQYRQDFEESRTALLYSPKASAALARRLLQRTLREALHIKKKDLSLEIDEFISSSNAPSYLTDAIDAVRTVGNFAAHPLKNTNTGEIVEVEAGEAEWLLEVLESLFDFVFVQPNRLEERRKQLNEKLKELGKPEMKASTSGREQRPEALRMTEKPKGQKRSPNWTVKRTPTRPMASPFSWALLVPSTRCAPSGAAYLVR